MKTAKKLLAFALVALMILALSVTAWATEPPAYSITIKNTYKDKEYNFYKILDAFETENGVGIFYYTTDATVRAALAASGSPFEVDETADNEGRYFVTSDANAQTIAAWIETNLIDAGLVSVSATVTGDGQDKTVTVDGPGYYYVTSSQGSVVTLDTVTSSTEIYDKNPTTISPAKTSDKESYNIGDTITYTATFTGLTNYLTKENGTFPVIKYVIQDTLPPFLGDVTVTAMTINGEAVDELPQFGAKKFIVVDWAYLSNGAYAFYYDAPATISLTYTATLTDTVNINAANTNTIKIIPCMDLTPDEPNDPDDPDNPDPHDPDDPDNPFTPWDDGYEITRVIYTYAAAIKKVDQDGAPLAGAQFTITGLTVTGSEGLYTVVSYDPTSTTESAVLDTDANGKLYIIGLAEATELTVTEYQAPEGYNPLDIDEKLTPQVLSEEVITETGTRYYDADGNLVAAETTTNTKNVEKNLDELDEDAFTVVNRRGTELPHTGGMGTTIYYALGALLLVGSVAAVSRKRRSSEA